MSKVFPSPGKPSSRQCPPATNAVRSSSTSQQAHRLSHTLDNDAQLVQERAAELISTFATRDESSSADSAAAVRIPNESDDPDPAIAKHVQHEEPSWRRDAAGAHYAAACAHDAAAGARDAASSELVTTGGVADERLVEDADV